MFFAVRMIRIDSGFTNYFSNVYLTLPVSAVETQNTTAANCCSSVKYGQAAWRISLPLITKARSEKENLIISLCAFPVYRLSQMAQPAKTLSRHRFLWPICDSTDIELSFTFNRHMHSGRMDGRMDGWPETLQQRSHLKKQKAVFFWKCGNWWCYLSTALTDCNEYNDVHTLSKDPWLLGLPLSPPHPSFWKTAFTLL